MGTTLMESDVFLQHQLKAQMKEVLSRLERIDAASEQGRSLHQSLHDTVMRLEGHMEALDTKVDERMKTYAPTEMVHALVEKSNDRLVEPLTRLTCELADLSRTVTGLAAGVTHLTEESRATQQFRSEQDEKWEESRARAAIAEAEARAYREQAEKARNKAVEEAQAATIARLEQEAKANKPLSKMKEKWVPVGSFVLLINSIIAAVAAIALKLYALLHPAQP